MNSGLKILQDEVRACFFLHPLTKQVDYDHCVWFSDRRQDFLNQWWGLTRKIDSLGYEGVFSMNSGLRLLQNEVRD